MKDYTNVLYDLDSYAVLRIKPKRNFDPVLFDLQRKMNEINEKTDPEDSYLKTLYNMTENYSVELKYAKRYSEERGLLYNAPVSFSYIKRYIQEMDEHFYGITTLTEKKMNDYKTIAETLNISLDSEISAINTYIENYKDTQSYKEFTLEVNRKISVLDELDIYIQNLDRRSWELSTRNEIPINSFIGQNYPTDFRNSPELADFVEILDKAKSEFSNYFVERKNIVNLDDTFLLMDQCDEIFQSIHNKLRMAGYQSCMADTFIDENSNKSISGFLKTQTNDDNKPEIVIMPEWSTIKKFFKFPDQSMIVQDNNGYKEVLSINDALEHRKKLINDYIQEEFRKKPMIGKFFKEVNEKIKLDGLDSLSRCINKYKENEAILKLNNFDVRESFKTLLNECGPKTSAYRFYEKFDDSMSKIVHEHKIKQFIRSISSTKYHHLYNEETYKLAKELYDLNLPDNSLQEYIGKKIAAFKTADEFNTALNAFLESLNSFTMEATLEKADKFGITVISANEENNEKLLILKINDFDESKAMGSTSWCIVREESYFHSYTKHMEQYFLFDFTKDKTDVDSMIGVTLYPNGDYHTAHYKDDSECYEEDSQLIQYLQDEVYEYKKRLKEENVSKIDQKEKLKR